MADLVIKPAPSTGNKLILQTQNETAVLTTSDAGVDSATSIVATKTGTETLTNKTLTAPTVADMSNFTFPQGHIIQTVYDTSTTETNTGSGTGWKNTALAVAITPTATSSLIMITYSIVISVNTTGYSAITSVFRGDVTGVNLGGPSPDYGTAFHGTAHAPVPHSAVVIDTPSTTSATTYTIGVRESADNQTYWCSNSSRATIVVQELAG